MHLLLFFCLYFIVMFKILLIMLDKISAVHLSLAAVLSSFVALIRVTGFHLWNNSRNRNRTS